MALSLFEGSEMSAYAQVVGQAALWALSLFLVMHAGLSLSGNLKTGTTEPEMLHNLEAEATAKRNRKSRRQRGHARQAASIPEGDSDANVENELASPVSAIDEPLKSNKESDSEVVSTSCETGNTSASEDSHDGECQSDLVEQFLPVEAPMQKRPFWPPGLMPPGLNLPADF